MINGILNVYKETGYTSHDVVAKLRGICGQKKIGHTGTLDPGASGVLLVCLGNGTGVCSLLTEKEKEYETTLLLGKVTDTLDMTGRVLKEKPVAVTEDEVIRAILSFEGGYDQIPPMYSALKQDGRRLYELARAGQEVERRPRRVEIPRIRILAIELPRVRFAVTCSRGTYIRSLCHDIGQRLGCGGAMEALTRTRVGEFTLESALKLGDIETLAAGGLLEQRVIGVEQLFSDAARFKMKPAYDRLLSNGNPVHPDQLLDAQGWEYEDGTRVRLALSDGTFRGLYEYRREEHRFRPVRMFL